MEPKKKKTELEEKQQNDFEIPEMWTLDLVNEYLNGKEDDATKFLSKKRAMKKNDGKNKKDEKKDDDNKMKDEKKMEKKERKRRKIKY